MLANVERLRDTTSRVCGALTCDSADSAGENRGSTRASAEEPTLVESIDALSDDVLARLISDASRARAEFDTVLTAAAGVAAKRSERALGHSGLAQRNGHQNAVRFVQSLTGASRGEASRASPNGVAASTSRPEPDSRFTGPTLRSGGCGNRSALLSLLMTPGRCGELSHPDAAQPRADR